MNVEGAWWYNATHS